MGRGTGVYMQDVHVHAGTEEGAVFFGPGPMEILLDGMRLSENPYQHNHNLSYHIILVQLDLFLYPLIQLEKLSFLLAMAMRFVIIKQVLIVFIVVLMNKEKDHSLGWVVLGVWCSVV